MADAVESQHAVAALLSQWAACGRLSYKFHVTPSASGRDALPRMMATFSKPTPQTPSPEAVARLYFHLSADHQRVRGFTVEQDAHFHDLESFKFDEAVLDRVVRRKLQLQSARLVDLSDEFASTRAPTVMRAREEDQREREREATEEYLLEQMQHSDSYNDGKLPVELFRDTVDALELNSSVVPREVLLALAAADRDDMMAYGDFVSVAADMIDTMSGADRVDSATPRNDDEDEALDAFEVVSARQTHYTVEKLTLLLEAHAERVAEVANAVAARRAAAQLEEAATAIPEESENEDQGEKEGNATPDTAPAFNEAPNEVADVDANSNTRSRRRSSAARRRSSARQQPPMPRYQLRDFLETPQLLLSEAEINLTLALAETKTNANGVEEVLCEKLGPLLRRVRRMIFRFQRKAFVDRLEKYLLQQFQAFEKRNLQGYSKHLKQRLTQKEVKAALKSMQKLLLSPYQLMQLVAISEEPDAPEEHVVYYHEFIPRMVQHFRELINVNSLAEKSALLHEMGVWDFATEGLPSEDVVRQASYECFASFDIMHLGVISTSDFRDALKHLAETRGFPVGTIAEMKQLSTLADLSSSGRVNYALFQHLMYPLLLYLHQERELAAAGAAKRNRLGEVGKEISQQ